MSKKYSSTAESGNIQEFIISSNSGSEAVDLSAGVSELRYYESILSNTVTATAVIVETGNELGSNNKINSADGLLDSLPIRGGERTDIKIVDATEEENIITFKDGLYVNRVRDADSSTQREVYLIDFSSKEYFSNDKTRVTERYEGKISDHINKILIEKLKTELNLDIDSTAINYNFYGNDRKPFYICTWLASKSIPVLQGDKGTSGNSVGGAAGYLFYQTRDSFHFKSIDNLLSQEPVRKFIYNNSTEIPDEFDAPILNYRIKSDIDLHEKLSLGTYNNRTIYFNPIAFNYEVLDYSINEQTGKITTAGKGNEESGKLVAKEFTNSPTRLMSVVLDVGYNPPGSNQQQQLEYWNNNKQENNFDAPKTMTQSIMRYNQLFTIQTEVTIAGDFSIKAGDIVNCTFPVNNSNEGDEINTKTSGKYLVAHVCHRITPRETFTTLSLIRDSYGQTR